MNVRWEFPFFITVKDKGGCHTVNCFSIKNVKFDKFCFNALHIRREIVHTAGREEGLGRFIIWRDTNFIRSLVSDPTQLGAGRRHELDRTQQVRAIFVMALSATFEEHVLGTDHIFSLYLVIHQNNSGGESRSHVLTWNISQSSLKLIRIFSFSLHICLTLHAPKCKAMLNIKIVRALPSTCCPSIVR